MQLSTSTMPVVDVPAVKESAPTEQFESLVVLSNINAMTLDNLIKAASTMDFSPEELTILMQEIEYRIKHLNDV
ncbi:MAG: hypothetical protein AAF153_03015 [Pseudomonadota bacterium]